MILIGQYDSSFVRRVGIALTLYGLPFEHRPWSILGDAERIRALNPLGRVPTLVLDDGTVLVDSQSIIDHIDRLVPEERRLYPVGEPDRTRAMRVAALANGLADKGVSLFYETRLHDTMSPMWVERCRIQILGTLAALEAERAARPGETWFGGPMGHCDIAVTASIRHVSEAHPALFDLAAYPALAAHCAHHEALEVFREIRQPFIAPA